MVDPSYGQCFPFENVDQQAGETKWRQYASPLGDGIVGPAYSGVTSGMSLARSASTRVVTLNLAPFRMRGCHFEPTQASLDLTVPAIATGRVRTDRLVAKFDNTAKNITFYIKAGVDVASTASPGFPSITRTAGGVWEIPLYTWTGGNVAADQLALTDQRVWVAQALHGVTRPGLNSELNLGRPDGSTFFDASTGHTWKQSYPGGVVTWTDLDDPPWTAVDLGTSLQAGIHPPEFRIFRGHLELRGEAGPKTGPWVGPGDKGLGVLPVDVAARIGFNRRLTIALLNTNDPRVLSARAVIGASGLMNFSLPSGVTCGSASYDNISVPLIPEV